jgi:4-hydroxybenzoate polyprenyltransferase
LAPLGAWVAVTGKFDVPGLLLAGAVAAWISAFDIIYACQDVDFDRQEGIHSIPARFGIAGGLWISRVLDVLTVVLFLLIPHYVSLGTFYYLGVMAVGVLLVYEHLLISPKDMSRIDIAFFKVNSIIAAIAFLFTFTDIGLKLI